jgi:hypothetical protein
MDFYNLSLVDQQQIDANNIVDVFHSMSKLLFQKQLAIFIKKNLKEIIVKKRSKFFKLFS